MLNRIIDALRHRHGGAFSTSVAVTAATGIAATHIGGPLPPYGLCMSHQLRVVSMYGLLEAAVRSEFRNALSYKTDLLVAE